MRNANKASVMMCLGTQTVNKRKQSPHWQTHMFGTMLGNNTAAYEAAAIVRGCVKAKATEKLPHGTRGPSSWPQTSGPDCAVPQV